LVKPLVDYPDDDDEDAMDTKPEDLNPSAETQPLGSAEAKEEAPTETTANSASPTVQTPPPPERLAEKRRREEEDEDELVKLATGPKRRSSTSSNSSAGSIRKKTLSIGSIGSVDKGSTGALGSATGSTPPKRIAINLGATAKSSPSDGDTTCADTVSSESNEKENRDDSQGDQGG
jgi:protein phosphatase 4 regulatory subunit 3